MAKVRGSGEAFEAPRRVECHPRPRGDDSCCHHVLSRRNRLVGGAALRVSSAMHTPGGPARVAGPARLRLLPLRVRLPGGLDEERTRAPGRARARASGGSGAGRPVGAPEGEGRPAVAVDARRRSTASRQRRSRSASRGNRQLPSRDGRPGVPARVRVPGRVFGVSGVRGGGCARRGGRGRDGYGGAACPPS